MSEVEKPKDEDKESQTDVSPHLRTVSLDKIIKRPESSGITINFYSPSYTLKSDKPVQTDTLGSSLLSKSSISSSIKSRKLASESREIRSFEYTQSTHKKINTPPHETRQNKFMHVRKVPENKPTARPIGDLERKKLEAELKATEEIARIQQAVIEKRLALELASLQDGNDCLNKNSLQQQPGAHDEPRTLEELTRKQNPLEYNLTHDLDSPADNAPRLQPLRPSLPTRQPLAEATKISNAKADNNYLTQTSTELNPLRQLIEKKINLDMGTARTSDLRTSPRASSHRERYTPYGKTHSNMPPYPPPDQPGCSPYAMRRMRNRSLWKSAVIKIKKKIKHSNPPPPPWQ